MSTSMTSLAELFPEGDYAFHLTLRRTEPREFFRPLDLSGEVLRERAHWLATDPQRYAALMTEGRPLLDEFVALAAGWSDADRATRAIDSTASSAGPANANDSADVPSAGSCVANGAGVNRCDHDDHAVAMARVGCAFEPDILFLSADSRGAFRLRGGALCFPTGWALADKLGQTLDAIHGVVPGLNPALGPSIQQFLAKLKPGLAYLRHNWGIAATGDLNLHPARGLAAPAGPVRLDRLWLRVEHQALVALPATHAIVFGIRIASHRLDEVEAGAARTGLRRALETMPAELAIYKRLEAIRTDVIRLL